MPQCAMRAFIIFMAACPENGMDFRLYSKPLNSKEAVPGTCIKPGFSLFYFILNLTFVRGCICNLASDIAHVFSACNDV